MKCFLTLCIRERWNLSEIKLFIPAGSYNPPQHLVEQVQIVIEEKILTYSKSNPYHDHIKL